MVDLGDHGRQGGSMTTTPARPIVHRTRGTRHGPLTRLIDPGTLGHQLKPFVLLDFLEKDGPRFEFGLHPHSGIATVTYIAQGSANYTDPSGESGILTVGSLEWMKAGRGMWHSAGSEAGPIFGIQLWLALPPGQELAPYEARYVAAETVRRQGPARVLLGSYGDAGSQVDTGLPINYLAVQLAAGEAWTYTPPSGHTVLWLAVANGVLTSPDPIERGELVVFDAAETAVTFVAQTETAFVIGSAPPHVHELVFGSYSVHTTQEALAEGERYIEHLAAGLRAEGRL